MKTRGFLWALGFIFTGLFTTAQTDSLANVQDSALAEGQILQNKLIAQRDSLRAADSLLKLELQSEIQALAESDAQERNRLKARIDSINQARTIRGLRLKQEVDSLRESAVGVPVVVFGDTIFFIYSKLGPFTPSNRAESIGKKVELLVKQGVFEPESLITVLGDESYDLYHNELILLSITDRDAFWLEKEKEDLVAEIKSSIMRTVEAYKKKHGLLTILKRVGLLLFVIALFGFGILYLNKAFTYLSKWPLEHGKKYITGLKFRNYEFLSAEREEQFLQWTLNAIKWIVIVVIVYIAIPIVFSIFPATSAIGTKLLSYVLNPLYEFGASFLRFIPDLISIVVILAITRYLLKFIKFLSREVETGKLQIPNFYSDWARPTYNLLKILIIAFAFVVIFPHIPGSNSPVFKGVSVFLGLLISLGSSSAIGNIIAGLVITYMRPFKMGDRVKIGDVTGDVIEKSMLVTRVRTIKNEDVTIPNAAILNGSTINFTSSAETLGLILNSTVTIGYDVPWRQVHELLISSALKTDLVKENPQPFVLQTSLDDFYVSYQINAYTEVAGKAAKIYSELHSHIQDAFNEAGIEIMSPHYRAERDGTTPALPESYRAKKE